MRLNLAKSLTKYTHMENIQFVSRSKMHIKCTEIETT